MTSDVAVLELVVLDARGEPYLVLEATAGPASLGRAAAAAERAPS